MEGNTDIQRERQKEKRTKEENQKTNEEKGDRTR